MTLISLDLLTSNKRNKVGGDINDMFLFKEVIGHLGLLELPLKGRAYTWSNMQKNLLLEQLDWFFTGSNWISEYPNSLVLPLAKIGLDHVPCVVNIDTSIPKTKLFRFENYWVESPGFMECVSRSWAEVSNKSYSSAVVADKLKGLRYDLKRWHVSLVKLKCLIQKGNNVIMILDTLEEDGPLFCTEFNFRKIVKLHLEDLLMAECNYWKDQARGRKHKVISPMATKRFRRNNITMLKDETGTKFSDH